MFVWPNNINITFGLPRTLFFGPVRSLTEFLFILIKCGLFISNSLCEICA